MKDVFILGGGPAGLTAALTLARGGRTVIIADHGVKRNAPASHMMNFPSHDGTPPLQFLEQIRQDLKKYREVEIIQGEIKSIKREGDFFLIDNKIRVRKILLAHGVRDKLPEISGVKELWGKSIFHCPYCHGYEFKDKQIGLLCNYEMALHMAPMLKGLSSDLVIFSNGEEFLDDSLFVKNGIKIYKEKVSAIEYERERLTAIKLENGENIKRDCLLIRPEQQMTSQIGKELGCEFTDLGFYKIDDSGMTTQKGIYAAGDIAEMRQSVLMACATGQRAAASINFAILYDSFL